MPLLWRYYYTPRRGRSVGGGAPGERKGPRARMILVCTGPSIVALSARCGPPGSARPPREPLAREVLALQLEQTAGSFGHAQAVRDEAILQLITRNQIHQNLRVLG